MGRQQAQLSQKMAAERTPHPLRHHRQQTTPETAPPPPYTAISQAQAQEEDDDDDDDTSDSEANSTNPLPISLTINAAHTITGSNNLIPTTTGPSPTILQDATRLSTLLLATLNQLNNHPPTTTPAGNAKRALKLDLTINCGLTLVGDRNVVGNVMLKPRGPGVGAMAGPGAGVGVDAGGRGEGLGNVVAGAKRKFEDGGREEGGAKRGRV
ncbi:hypothetical protein EJ03DRAFT_21976 [Teratosphaeria nubilosa]|uniref:Uncharacterized protein n=1 Tax=Teratosphaeria nubilosa TaxID=161662 RepID=A0A6G1LGI8_9PEZI|nr:hypothetical protein EJ03DRAFT_21976 [Teratosphaeria nubilosa]